MFEAYENRRSWLTQRLANRFPPWTRLRKDAQSYGQQMLEPMGRELESWYWWENYQMKNYLLNTSDLNQMGGLSRLSLPSSFEWTVRHDSDTIVYLPPRSVTAKTSDGVSITLSQAYNNTVEDFWYGLPSRISSTGESISYQPIISFIKVEDLGSVAPRSIGVPGKLFITLTDNGSAIKSYHGGYVRSSVDLEGRDLYGKKTFERVFFSFNGTLQTKRSWSEIDSVETNYIDNTAYIRVDWLPIGGSDILENYGLSVTPTRERFKFYALGIRDSTATLQQKHFSAPSFSSVQDGDDNKDIQYETTLLDTSESAITSPTAMALWPQRRWLVVCNGSKLHFFPTGLPYPDYSPLVKRSQNPVLQLQTDKEFYCSGDTVRIDYVVKHPFWIILRSRLSVEKPDGTIKSITTTGNEQTYSNSAWATNENFQKFRKVGFQQDPIEYELDSSGIFVFYLETIIKNPLGEIGAKPTRQTDVRIVSAKADVATESLSLPTSTGWASDFAFDSYGRPWTLSDQGVATRLDFHYDKFLVDYDNKSIYVREDYDYLEVVA